MKPGTAYVTFRGFPLCPSCTAPVDDLHEVPIHYWTEDAACDPGNPATTSAAVPAGWAA